MQEYLYSLLLVAVIALLCELLLPTRSEGVRRAVSFGIALFSLLVLARPLAGLSDPSFSLQVLPPSFSEDFSGDFSETEAAMAKGVEEGIVQDIAAHFGLREGEIAAKVTLALTKDQLSIASLALTLSGSAYYADHIAIAEYAKKTYQITGEVLVNGGERSFF